jgi:hypothetical protein
MEHPVFYLARVTKFLDQVIQEHGVYLFMAFVAFSFVLLVWMFTRRRTRPVHDISVVILPLGPAPRREPEPEPVLFRDKEEY